MSENGVKEMIAEVFNDIAEGIKSGRFKKKARIGLTIFGSELFVLGINSFLIGKLFDTSTNALNVFQYTNAFACCVII